MMDDMDDMDTMDTTTSERPPGIRCPNCGCQDVRLPNGAPVDTQVTKTEQRYGYIRRRRVCRYCGRVIYTRETVEQV